MDLASITCTILCLKNEWCWWEHGGALLLVNARVHSFGYKLNNRLGGLQIMYLSVMVNNRTVCRVVLRASFLCVCVLKYKICVFRSFMNTAFTKTY